MTFNPANKSFYFLWLFIFQVLPAVGQYDVQEIERTDEKELKVRLEYAAGKLSLKKISTDKLARITIQSEDREVKPTVDYEKNGTTGMISMRMDEENNVGFFDVGNQDIQMYLTDKIPVSFKIDLGACESEMDFTQLRVRDLTLNMGASSSNIRFSSLNRDRINKFRIEAGISKLNMYGLGNANFEKLEFEGGVGNYMLDFSGTMTQSASAHITVGIGSLIIRLPQNLAVKIHTDESYLSSIRIDQNDFVKKRDGLYISKGFDAADAVLELHLETGLGKLRVESIK
ncbi:MAG TPA: toast rack family protein [bacterium]|nr:toast rack family protein [bacterium]HMW33811.1 toast rack family protein [bacterium]HMY36685.1 toast rack family protein [bacterium]HMZ04526.1 toast rack family protein [bacterium]HND78058.1 toast rack family protein [bacterium]